MAAEQRLAKSRPFTIDGQTIAPRQLADTLLAHGRHWVTTDDIAALLDVPRDHVPQTVAGLIAAGRLFSPARGAYVPIPAQYRTWRAVPATQFIDSLMGHLDHNYYVALLSAAELVGVAHQRPQTFQVVTNGRVRDRSFGRVKLEFVTSQHANLRPTVTRNTPTGTMVVSTPEVTAFDLVAMPRRSGGLSNVATVIGEMVDRSLLEPTSLADVATTYPISVVARTGWLIAHSARTLDVDIDLDALRAALTPRHSPIPLLAGGRNVGAVDTDWNVYVNTSIEADL